MSVNTEMKQRVTKEKGLKFLEQLSGYLFLKKDSFP